MENNLPLDCSSKYREFIFTLYWIPFHFTGYNCLFLTYDNANQCIQEPEKFLLKGNYLFSEALNGLYLMRSNFQEQMEVDSLGKISIEGCG